MPLSDRLIAFDPLPEAHPLLAERLRRAATTPIDLDGMHRGWRITRITALIWSPRPLEPMQAIPRLRGAFGTALGAERLGRGAAAAGAPTAAELFFRSQGRIHFFHPDGSPCAVQDLPKPFVFSLDPQGEGYRLSLDLFGFAGEWADVAAEALRRALSLGLDMAGDRKLRLALLDLTITRAEGLPAHEGPVRLAALEFLTPLSLRAGEMRHAEPAAVIEAAWRRSAAMALWHGATPCLTRPAISPEGVWQAAQTVSWVSGSRRQGRVMPGGGVQGHLVLSDPAPLDLSMLHFGTTTHIGSHTSKGAGRYDLHLAPPG